MKFTINPTRSLHQIKADAIAIGVFDGDRLCPAAAALDRACDHGIKAVLDHEFKADAGETLVLRNLQNLTAPRVILVGLGKNSDYTLKTFIKAHESLFRTARKLSLQSVASTLLANTVPDQPVSALARLAAQTLQNQTYQYSRTLSNQPEPVTLDSVEFLTEGLKDADDAELKTALKQGKAIGKGMKLTRELGDLPGNICTPTYLGEQARQLAKDYKNIHAEILERKHLEALKMGSFLSVAAGSEQPPRFIVLRYEPKGTSADKNPVVLVGKGVTFDSGGISLKPGAGMDEMKYDMCGAATVFGVFKFLAESNYPQSVVGLIPSTENMPSGRATKPGDVVTSMSGKTIEILNTDAEGRLILCDALTYAERFEPAAVIDICTLTGACIVALGHVNSGLLSNNDDLAQQLLQAGKNTSDKAWQMPLDDEYQSQLKSNFADMANIGGRPAGTITAACFLSRFAEKYPWAHLDIAGTAWLDGKQKGATGRPVPLLARYLLDRL